MTPRSAHVLNEIGPNASASARSQILFGLVRVVEVGERDRDRHVAGSLAAGDDDLVVARHVDHAIDRGLERGHVGVEQLAAGEVIEQRARFPIGVRVARLPALCQHRRKLLFDQRDVLRFGREGALGEPADQERGGAESNRPAATRG